MSKSFLRAFTLVGALLLVLGLAACGGSSKSSSSGGAASNPAPPSAGKKGGNLTVLYAGELDYIDPGATYYSGAFPMFQTIVRPLYGYLPDKTTIRPDIADGLPKLSKDNKTVTVQIKKGLKFGPPVNREITAADVKYGIERSFKPKLTNGYVGTYFSNVIGFNEVSKGKALHASGITTKGKYTLIIKLSKPEAYTVSQALVLPNSAPVPEKYAAKFDASKDPAAYGTHQISSGPYMIKNNAAGATTGYKPGKEIDLVRNPNWDPKTDYRPAYVNTMTIKENNTDTSTATRQILNGQSLISGDFQPAATDLKLALQKYPAQTKAAPPGGYRLVALDTHVKPFNDINMRKAVIAASDRTALRLTRGGAVIGDVATHYIPPGFLGFDEAGGVKGFQGPQFDFVSNPSGNMAVAKKYLALSKEKIPSTPLLLVADNSDPGKSTGQVVAQQLQKLGFKIKSRFVDHAAMYTKFCNVPKSAVAVCPNVGWFKDFYETGSMLNPTFNGKSIIPSGNVNYSQLNDPKLNKILDDTNALSDPAARTKGWVAADRQITLDAPAIPWVWDKEYVVESKNVQGVINNYNAGWDLAFTSIK
jgi:peptide/nickel transport system substrate-binding protein